MKRAFHLLLIGCFALCSCTASRLSHDEARKKIAEIGRSNLIPDAIEIRRMVSQSQNEAIAEANITLAFQFRRANPNADWKIEAVRLGDRDWISLNELLAAINESRRRTTTDAMQQLSAAIDKYRTTNGALPNARDIVSLTDMLHPRYMDVLVREDGWGNPIVYQVTGPAAFRLVSRGPDGREGTTDDIVFQNGAATTP
jgi:Type II secretion system (T2SS), protein G